MLKLGTKCIKNLKLGDKTIFKGIKGGKTVYRNYPIFLDYIEFDGKSYINPNINTFGTWNVTAQGADARLQFLLGTGAGGAGNWFGITASGYWGAGANHYFDIPYTEKITASVTFSSTGVTATIDDTTIFREGANGIDNHYYLGSHIETVTVYHFKGKVYGCSFTDTNGVLTLDLRPAIDPCGVVCMYDMVTNKYFYNQGTGEFVAGGRFVESIVFDGASYIDTGIKMQDCTVTANIKLENTGYRQFVGTWGASAGHYWSVTTSNQLELGGTYVLTNSNTTEFTNVTVDFNITDKVTSITSKDETITRYHTTNTADSSYILGNVLATEYSGPIKGQVYSHTFTNVDGVLIQDLRPYVDENGVACFKDVVTDTLFYNQGTGTLTYIDFEHIPYLEFDRTTYIDTEYIPNKNTEFTYKVKLYQKQGDINPVFGVRIAYSISCYNLLQIGNGPRLDWNETGNIVYLNAMVGNTSTLKIGKGRVLLNGSSVATYTQKETELSHSFFIGNMNENGVVYSKNGSKQDVCFCSLSENGIPKRELYPVKRSDGVKCLYDRVENKYYELKVA